MGFEIPEYLQGYLSNEYRKPVPNYVNTSQYYANLAAYYITYMNSTVRQCMAYATGTVDGMHGSILSANLGYNIVSTATKLIKGDKLFFNGDDEACEFLSDIWSEASNFDNFLEKAINYTLAGGTCAFKLNIDRWGKCVLSASRCDRSYINTDDCGDVVEATFFITQLSSQKSANGQIAEQYWLIERRYYEGEKAVVEYNVHRKGGIANSEVLPSVYDGGIAYEQLPDNVRRSIDRQGITVNTPLELPFIDGLGVWVLTRTATNSCIPDVEMGDPLLYGCLDLLWSLDVVYSGSLIDVLNGKGHTLLPKRFASTIVDDLNKAAQKAGIQKPTVFLTSDMQTPDDSFVWIYTEDDKDFIPQSIQFEIRSDRYREMWELYQKQIAVNVGFSPSSLFPHLADNSAKTATEVTAEENLTRATVQSTHRLLLPKINRALKEVLRQNGFNGKATLQLSDYIGNKLQRDDNLRRNYEAGALPREDFVQLINNLTVRETKEYLSKINEDEALRERFFGNSQNIDKTVDVDYI